MSAFSAPFKWEESISMALDFKLIQPSEAFCNVRHKIIQKHLSKKLNVPSEADLIIKIGEEQIRCKRMILHFFSKRYKKMENHSKKMWDLTGEHITMVGLKKAYNWMVAEEPKIDLDYILPTLQASTYLDAERLSEDCWANISEFYDADAVLLYLEARRWGCFPVVETCMLKRIDSVFMKFVATKEFLKMTADAVCQIADAHARGSKRVVESFMSMVLWLNYQWPERKKHVVDMMKYVPFNLFPTFMLAMLLSGAEGDVCVRNVVKYPEVRDIVKMGLVVKTAFTAHEVERKPLEDFFIKTNENEAVRRMWKAAMQEVKSERNSVDKDFKHKTCIPIICTEQCPMKHIVSFSAFVKHLESQ